MNYLAHILLSGADKRVAVGNFIGDGVKGKIGEHYPREIQIGLHLHRFMDDFADTDEVNREGREALFEPFGKYAGVVQDMYHDHFLALHWDDYVDDSIHDYLNEFYLTADGYLSIFPNHQLRFLEGIRQGDWLINYAEFDGMNKSFKGLARRIKRKSAVGEAGVYLEKHHEELAEHFHRFFPIIAHKTSLELERLLTKL